MTAPDIARMFRSPELRDLAGLAAAQGWNVAKRPGGHVALTDPDTGAMVLMSGTGYVTHGTLARKRAELARAGLDLAWSRKAARATHRQEVAMHVREATVAEVATLPVQSQDHPTPAGGRFRMDSPWTVHHLAGHEVRVGHRADGVFVAKWRDASARDGWRTWYGPDRDALVARVETSLATGVAVGAPAQGRRPAMPVGDVVPAVVAEVLDRATVAAPAAGGGWHVVQVEDGEYPLAAALDRLDATLAPALEALEAAGKTDAAALLRGEVVRTPQESELLALYRRVMRAE